MYVQKRDGSKEGVSFDKVLNRIRKSARGLLVNPDALSQQVLSRIYDGVPTTQLDELTAANAASLGTVHPDWGTLAARIAISNHQKNTDPSFANVVHALSNQKMKGTGDISCMISKEILEVVVKHGEEIDAYIKHDRDYLLDYFGFKTLEKSYLLRDTSMKILERPQHMWMRVALALWSENLPRAFETYDLLSQKFMTHATPTLFNAGTPRQQLSSCYLLAMHDDSIAGIYKTLGDCAAISKYAGGIGIHMHNVRARGSLIRGTNGTSNGLTPMLRVFNNTARYVDQCFTPDTLVYTLAGAKAIEDVSVTDRVLTSTGAYEAVKVPVRHEYNGQMLEIQVKNAVYPVRVTPEHQVLALKDQAKGLNFDVIRNRLEKGYAKAEFSDARDLREGDFLVFPIPQYECDVPSLTEEDCRLYGILLGDGYISRTISGISVNNTTKQGVYDFVLDYLTKRGITVYPEQEGEHSLKLRWSTANPGFKFTLSQLYDSDKQKRIDTPFLHLPLSKVQQVVRGLLETDGCIGSKEISFEVSSYPLMEGMRYLLLRMGALASGYERNRVGSVSSTRDIHTNLPTSVLRVPRIAEIMKMFPSAPAGEYFTYLKYQNNLYTRIQTITETIYEGVVHDFEIEGPHDYTVSHLGVAHNGGGKRNGSFAVYLEPWHADVEDFVKLKLNSGAEEERARDLFYAMWIPDLFMERVEADGDWTLFCPMEAPGLSDVCGEAFRSMYTRYEAEGRGRKTVKAQKLWFQILDAQMETGTPYLVYKDAANLKSNQQNLGTIKSSNLCSEIIEFSNPQETAVCNLASLALPSYVKDGKFDFEEMMRVVRVTVRNLNRVIDINFYPTPETKRSNLRHRPIGLGVQGLADVFAMLKMSWEDDAAAELNQLIFEHMYFAAVETSCKLAEEEGAYESFFQHTNPYSPAGHVDWGLNDPSPAALGRLQPDLWGVTPITETRGTLDWPGLREKAKKGMRNSLLMAPMPTASTSQILGYNECFEPFTNNLYTRRTLAGEFIVLNKHLMNELLELGLWNEGLKQEIIARNGSVQGIAAIPEEIQARYKTTWELKQRILIDMAAARGAFICQSQSLNLFVADPNYAKLTSMHFYAWKKGLKTGCYYLRTKAPVAAQKFTVDPRLMAAISGGASSSSVDDGGDSDADTTDSEHSDDEEISPEELKKKNRKEMMDRLAAEYEEEVQKTKEAADKGEGCLFCSA
uniref:ribonucleoside-diphosphate reductase n=1 Tax=viral metagenome TaxID=1070528 RepID=A0A6C0BJ28_9ZZZZ